ncbi:efflux RND transporter periplasmic adaptor subunit [Aurantivibrio infirmus]
MKVSTTNSKSFLSRDFSRAVLSLAFVATALMTSACNPNNADASDEDKAPQAVSVEVTKVLRGDIQLTYGTITTLEAEREAQIVARTSGILEKILVEEGDAVAEGQILAQLDTEQLLLQVAQLEVVVKRLETDLQREETLFKRQIGTSTNLERARSDYESQKAQLELAMLNLRYATIRAPFAGIITERVVKTGNLIQANDKLFTVVDPNSLQAIIHLPQKELAQVAIDQPAFLSVDAFPDNIIEGKIKRIRPQIETDTGTFQVIVAINNSDSRLKAGMFGRVEIIFDVHQDTLLLTDRALITQDNRSHVFVVRDGIAVQTPVKLAIKHKDIVEVSDGLEEGDDVIISGQTILKNGAKVEIIEG